MPQRALSILLVEDSALDSRLLFEGLKPAIASGEVIVQTVKRLSQAIDEMRTSDFSCVLLDLGLPDGQGIGNVSALREVDRKAAIVVLTGLDDEKLAVEALKLGAQDYLVKGAAAGDGLMRMVRRAVQRNRQTVALETRRDQAFFEASHDAQTLLPNAALFADRARQLVNVLGSQTLTCLRLHGVDAARTRYGPVVADALLVQSAQLLGEGLPVTATLARLDAATFGLVGLPDGERLTHLEALRQRLKGLTLIGGCAVQVAVQVGSAEVVDAGGIDAGLEAATAAAAAAASTDETATPEPVSSPAPSAASQTTETATRWQLWADLRDGQFAGAELLPVVASAAPGEALLAQAAQLARQWQQWQTSRFEPALVGLSVSAAALADERVPAELATVLKAAGLSPMRVQLNVSEAAFRELARHQPALTRLRFEGFRIVMDGDGSTDIALADLAAFPVDVYRLSQGFTRQLLAENLQGRSRRLLTALLGAAEALGAGVIANGVDTREAVAALRLIGIHSMQGRVLAPDCAADSLPIVWERGTLRAT